ncbi:MAG: flagellar basal body rod protein FlgB [Chloroflexi bacterium]|nr:flagellar basal body rod protein FlgB [Chloroflexota bacterium]
MPSLINDPTSVVVSKALDGLALRQKVTANNIANVDTPNFKGSVVTFEDTLKKAVDQQGTLPMTITNAAHITGSGSADAGPAVVTMQNTTMRTDGNNVDIDREMSTLADTNITYNALLQFMSKKLDGLRSIITDGRG